MKCLYSTAIRFLQLPHLPSRLWTIVLGARGTAESEQRGIYQSMGHRRWWGNGCFSGCSLGRSWWYVRKPTKPTRSWTRLGSWLHPKIPSEHQFEAHHSISSSPAGSDSRHGHVMSRKGDCGLSGCILELQNSPYAVYCCCNDAFVKPQAIFKACAENRNDSLQYTPLIPSVQLEIFVHCGAWSWAPRSGVFVHHGHESKVITVFSASNHRQNKVGAVFLRAVPSGTCDL